MSQRYLETTALRRAAMVGVIALGLCLAGANAGAAGGVDPEADRILKSMASYLGKLPALSVQGDVDDEVIDLAGQKLQFSSSANVVVERPGRFYAQRQGPLADVEAIFDGKTLTLHGKRLRSTRRSRPRVPSTRQSPRCAPRPVSMPRRETSSLPIPIPA